MNEVTMEHATTNADEAPSAPNVPNVPSGVAQRGGQQSVADRLADDNVVLFDTRGWQINPLPIRMTVAEALDDSFGLRR